MKKVILEQEGISIDNLNDSHIIGVQMKEGYTGTKGQIRRISYNTYVCVQIGENNDFEGYPIAAKSIPELIRRIGIDKIEEVIVFDSNRELFNWILK
jgi:hypothetical protein